MDLKQSSDQLRNDIENALKKVDLEKLIKRQVELKKVSLDPNLWQDAENAQNIMRELANVENDVEQWKALEREIIEFQELCQLEDDDLIKDLTKQLKQLQKKFDSLKSELVFGGPYDFEDAILGIYAGAGGTDAQDWASMLLRMYSRWADKEGYDTVLMEESAGDEAGLKSVQISIGGRNVYGKLKGEHGVHRLVRLSPFNANNLRQTSFAKVEVLPKIKKPEQIVIDEKDLKIDVFRSGGHGGQSVNTTDSAVRVTHLPTNIVVTIQNERSQIQNKETALTILRSKLASLQIEQHAANLKDLKGPNQSAEWGNQVRNYVLHPYSLVKDLRTKYETSNVQDVLDGNLNPFIESFLTRPSSKQ